MPTQLSIERLTFTFDDTWTFAVKWDEEKTYLSGVERLKGELDNRKESTKAVDLVAVKAGTLVLAEAKDFRPAIDSQAGLVPVALAYDGRWKSLPLEIALKVRDTLAGLVGCVSRCSPTDMANAVSGTFEKPIRVVAFVVQRPRQTEPESKRKIRAGEMRKSLQTKLSWVTRDVVLVDPLNDPDRLGGVSVMSRRQ